MEVETNPELAVVKLIWTLRYEAPKARLSGGWFRFPRKGWAVKAAERLFTALGHPIGRSNDLSATLKRDYVTVLYLSGRRPMMAIITPEGGERLVLSARGAKVEAPYDRAYVEFYVLLQRGMRQRRKRSGYRNDDAARSAVEHYWRSWQALNGNPSGGEWPPFDGGWPDVPPLF